MADQTLCDWIPRDKGDNRRRYPDGFAPCSRCGRPYPESIASGEHLTPCRAAVQPSPSGQEIPSEEQMTQWLLPICRDLLTRFDNYDCTCADDYDSVCWYHLSKEEKAQSLAHFAALSGPLSDLVARLRTAEQDTKRLDWLERQVYESHPDEPERIDSIGSVSISGAWPGKGIARVYLEVGEENVEASGDSLREAIDAASSSGQENR